METSDFEAAETQISPPPAGAEPLSPGRGLELPAGCRERHEDLSHDALLQSVPRSQVDGMSIPLLGGILLLRRLGSGGFGTVYAGFHTRLSMEVAVKVLSFHIASRDPSIVTRFLREARLAAGIHSPHLVRVMDVDEQHGLNYLVMELVDGITADRLLAQRLAEGQVGLGQREALEIGLAVTHGLAAAHAQGIVHRDIKPDNIMLPLDQEGVPSPMSAKLADLGLARQTEAENLTLSTQGLLGTPGFMAPEQIRDSREARAPADIFSLGATLYCLLAGRHAFEGSSPVDTVLLTLNQSPAHVDGHRPDLARSFARLVMRCLARDPRERFEDAAALLEGLQRVQLELALLEGKEDTSPPPLPAQPARSATTRRAPVADGFSFLRYETVSIRGKQHSLRVHRFDPFAEALGLRADQTDVACEFMEIPSGRFLMGSAESEPGSQPEERPRHRVAVPSLLIARTPVILHVWWALAGSAGLRRRVSRLGAGGDWLPVHDASWLEATQFTEALGLRLPGEAEWEFACRAGTATRFATGDTDEDLDAAGWYRGNSRGQLRRVGLKQANGFALLDLHGNVLEWCADLWHDDYEGAPVDGSPWLEPATDPHRVARGGHQGSTPNRCRSAFRWRLHPDQPGHPTGLRPVVSVDAAPVA